MDYIYWSKNDTPETVAQAKAHNAVLKGLGCKPRGAQGKN